MGEDAPELNEDSSKPAAPEPAGPRIPLDCVLVVEDSKPMNAVVKTMFLSLGFAVVEMPSGLNAKYLIETVPEIELLNVVLIFSDFMMPGLDGLSLLKFVRSHPLLGETPFVMATAAANADLVKEAKALKVSGFFVKPLSYKRPSELLQKLFPQRKFPTEGDKK